MTRLQPTSDPQTSCHLPPVTCHLYEDWRHFGHARFSRPENSPDCLPGVEHILHAGDIGSDGIVVGLESVAPVTAVLGNTDSSPTFRLTEAVKLAGRKFLVQHIVNPRALTEELRLAHRARAAGRGGVRPHAQGVLPKRLTACCISIPATRANRSSGRNAAWPFCIATGKSSVTNSFRFDLNHG